VGLLRWFGEPGDVLSDEALSNGREVMDAKQAAAFLRISESEFRRMAPGLPRHAVTERRFIYLRSELLAWLTRR